MHGNFLYSDTKIREIEVLEPMLRATSQNSLL